MTLRLVLMGQEHWSDVNGQAVSTGIKLKRLPLRDFTDYVWWTFTKDAAQEEKENFKIWLWRPPRGVKATTGPWSPEAETQAFMELKQQLGM